VQTLFNQGAELYLKYRRSCLTNRRQRTLVGNEARKTGWMRAEAAGDTGPWRQQAILGRRDWDGDALRDIVRDYALETLADDDAVLVIDETGFLKQGKATCGVARQYTGSAGKITNCQIGVFASYVSRHGHAFIDRALYLPQVWTDDPDRMAAVYVPDDVGFATKPQIARTMIARAWRERGVLIRCR
jgi:SRSO17 transposase